MYEVGITGQFEAAHRLSGNFGPATRLHGHTYRVDVVVHGLELQPDGSLLDLGVLQEALQATLRELNYTDLAEVPGLAGRNTTVETVADYCWRQLAGALAACPGVTRLLVRVWESPQVYAGRDDPLLRP